MLESVEKAPGEVGKAGEYPLAVPDSKIANPKLFEPSNAIPSTAVAVVTWSL